MNKHSTVKFIALLILSVAAAAGIFFPRPEAPQPQGGSTVRGLSAYDKFQTLSPVTFGIVMSNGISTTSLSASSTPNIPNINATSTTATSTFAGFIDVARLCIKGTTVCLSSGSTFGTVTSVATNNGITGGTITGAGTIGLDLSALGTAFGLPLTLNGSNQLTATGTASFAAPFFIGTSTVASRFPYASTTALSVSGLTSTRVHYSGTGGILQDSAGLTYNGTALTATYATTTSVSIATELNIPSASAPLLSTTGDFALDTTSDELKYYGGSQQRQIVPFYTTGFSISTSTAGTGTTTISLAPAAQNLTFKNAFCEVNTGTFDVSLWDGTNRANMIIASSTVGTFTFSTNNAFTKATKILVDVGTAASSPVRIGCRFTYEYDSN